MKYFGDLGEPGGGGPGFIGSRRWDGAGGKRIASARLAQKLQLGYKRMPGASTLSDELVPVIGADLLTTEWYSKLRSETLFSCAGTAANPVLGQLICATTAVPGGGYMVVFSGQTTGAGIASVQRVNAAGTTQETYPIRFGTNGVVTIPDMPMIADDDDTFAVYADSAWSSSAIWASLIARRTW